MRKGFVYTLFAIFLLNLLVLTIVLPLQVEPPDQRSSQVNIDELFYFMTSIEDDMARAIEISGRRSLVAATNEVINEGSAIANASDTIAEAFYNGTIDGNQSGIMADSSFLDWVTKMESQATAEGYGSNLSTNLSDVTVSMVDPFRIQIGVQYNLSLEDPRIDARFDRTGKDAASDMTITGIDDPLIVLETAGKRTDTIEKCTDQIAEQRFAGTAYEYNYTDPDNTTRNWTSGDAYVTDAGSVSGVADKHKKILVTPDLCSYSVTALDDFAGVMSENTTDGTDVCGSGEEIDGYVGGIGNYSTIDNDTRLVMTDADGWVNTIPDRIDSRCFFVDTDGPAFLDRLAGRLNGTDKGIASFLDVPELPPEFQRSNTSAIDHVYFDMEGSYGTTWKIKGVSDHRAWFRLDDDHVDSLNLTELAYR